MESINPYNFEVLKKYPDMQASHCSDIISKSHEAFLKWRKQTIAQRCSYFKKLAEILQRDADEYSFLITQEMGKLITESKAEILKCAQTCEYYATRAEDFLADEQVSTDAQKSYISYQPLGVIFAIMPWNFPFWQVLRFAIPTLLAGNTAVLKHASNVTGCALAIENLFLEAGFPKDIFRTLVISATVASELISHPLVQAVTLTGSTEAGKNVASLAGQNLKKCVLELGGSDPYIICEDADLESAVDLCFKTRFINAGQSCIAGKRFIIHDSLYEEFKTQLKKKMTSLETGDPLFATTTLAPLAGKKHRDQLQEQVLKAIKHGATLVMGGDFPLGRGAFYNSTILEAITAENPIYKEELFGPVAALYRFQKIEDALKIANETSFGLGAAIITKDIEAGENLARNELMAGMCFVNSIVKSSPELPFGGIKTSGYGRELSKFGIREFVNIKTVYIK